MVDFFAAMYEWFGLIPLYRVDLGDHLRGFDPGCSGDFSGSQLYIYVGFGMMASAAFIYALQYHIIDSPKFSRPKHWWLMALVLMIINFFIAFIPVNNDLQAVNYCTDLIFDISDCVFFGISNSIWSLLILALISTPKLIRNFSTNCRHTTFYKPF